MVMWDVERVVRVRLEGAPSRCETGRQASSGGSADLPVQGGRSSRQAHQPGQLQGTHQCRCATKSSWNSSMSSMDGIVPPAASSETAAGHRAVQQ